MGQVVNDLVTKFSFDGSIRPLLEHNGAMGKSIALVGTFGIAVEGIAAGFAMWANRQLEVIDNMGTLSRQTKVAVETIQELNYAAEQNDSSAAAIESTIRGLTKTIGAAALKGSEDFARLGISVRDANGQVKKADQVLEEVGARFRALGLSIAEQESFAGALGIDNSLLQMLGKSSAEMAQLRARARELGIVTKEQTEDARRYEESIRSMNFALSAVKQQVAIGVAPELGRLADEFTTLLVANKGWIIDGIKATVGFVGDLLASFNRLLPVFALMAAGFVAMQIAAIGFGGVMAVVFSPVTLITAAIVALLLIVDDLIVAFQGGQSVIADFFKEMFGIDIVDVLTTAFKFMAAAVGFVIDGFKIWWDWYTRIVKAIIETGAAVAEFFGAGGDKSASMQAGQTNIPVGASPAPGGARVDNRSVSQSNQIVVYSSDPEAAGRSVNDNLQRQLENADTQFSPGGM